MMSSLEYAEFVELSENIEKKVKFDNIKEKEPSLSYLHKDDHKNHRYTVNMH